MQNNQVTEDQLAEFQQVTRERVIERNVQESCFQRVLDHQDLVSRVDQLIDELGYDPSDVLESMRQFYRKFFGFDCPDLTGLSVPIASPGFNWVLPIVAIHDSYPLEEAYQGLAKHFGCWRYHDSLLDEMVTQNARDSRDGPYIIRLRDRVEADEELLKLSAVNIADRRIKAATLYERFILEGWYYAETGEHLDIQNITLCAGSRSGDDRVPSVFWRSDVSELVFRWYDPSDRDSNLSVREVVS